MTSNKLELGYSHDIALEQILELYASSREFKRDWLGALSHLPEIQQYRSQRLKAKRKDGVIWDIIEHGDNYTRLTKEWQEDWEAALKVIPESERLELEKLALKWGLNCDWACGLLINSILHNFKFVSNPGKSNQQRLSIGTLNWKLNVFPGPPDSTRRLSIEVSIYDTNESINKKLATLKKQAVRYRNQARKNLSDLDYRIFGNRKKDIQTQVQWLFWHITPPYYNAVEIITQFNIDADPFYVQRRYQNVAKLLGIKLTRGWIRGRKRNRRLDGRLKFPDEIEVK